MSHSRVPKLQYHRASGRAVVRLGGMDHYLGQLASPFLPHDPLSICTSLLFIPLTTTCSLDSLAPSAYLHYFE